MDIRTDNLEGEEIALFLTEHMQDMRATSPPESTHALDLEGLKAPGVSFWSVHDEGKLVGCGALKELDPHTGEIKSMRVRESARGKGVGRQMLAHIIKEARQRGYTSLKLETGSMAFFEPARQLYLRHGFVYCEPFGSYRHDPNSVFMALNLSE